MRFEELDIPDQLRRGIDAQGFTQLTEVQEQAIPLALEGKDIAAQAQTGTGKTAAFIISLYTRLMNSSSSAGKQPRALVIAPTRELVAQIASDAEGLTADSPITMMAVYGGVDYDKQRQALAAGVDVIVATPGRLIDYAKQKVFNFSKIEVLVIDEADRMFDMGFIKDLRFILRRLPDYDKRQTMLYSATLSPRVMELAYDFMNDPVKIQVEPKQVTGADIDEVVYHVGRSEKIPLLLGLLQGQMENGKVMVFANTKRETEYVTSVLRENGHRAALISGDLNQPKRMRILQDFKDSKLDVLVATDVASRGIHIDDVTHVVNYDVPQDPEDYVHRIGRTARAGASGLAIMFADEELVYNLPPIEECIGHKIPHDVPMEEMFRWDFKRPRPQKRRPAPSPRGKKSSGAPSGTSKGKGPRHAPASRRRRNVKDNEPRT
ncbi:MAG: DEAD/DEAH box helicase [Desulfuromonadaceae bacterium]|nr:DEAD/DEAH box helicase [Desulfuromonadaceae bacterium]